jgi:hypothetical protein
VAFGGLANVDKIIGFDFRTDKLSIEYKTSGNVAGKVDPSLSYTTVNIDNPANFAAQLDSQIRPLLEVNETSLVWVNAIFGAGTDAAVTRYFLVINSDLTAGYNAEFDTIIEFVEPVNPIVDGVIQGLTWEDLISRGTPDFYIPQDNVVINTATGQITGDAK